MAATTEAPARWPGGERTAAGAIARACPGSGPSEITEAGPARSGGSRSEIRRERNHGAEAATGRSAGGEEHDRHER